MRLARRGATLVLLALAAVPLLADSPSPAALMESGHWKRARALAEQRLAANPNDAQAIYVLARYKLAAGDYDAAIRLGEKLVVLEPRNADYHYVLAGACGEKARNGGIFSQMGLARRFKKEAEAAVALDPKHVEARMGLIQFHLQAPGIVGGDKARARTLADEVMRLDPVRGYFAQARIAIAEKQTGRLEELYRKAVEADPRSYIAHTSLANFYAGDAQKKYELAEKHAREALKLDPDRIGAYSMLAALAAYREQWAELDGVIAQAEKAIPDNLLPYYRAGNVLLGSGKDLARAERYFRKYLAMEPEPGAPQNAHAWWRLGLVLEKQGRKPEAVAALQNAVRLKPDLDEAKKDLKRLR
jgi:tetratricopeptide (TPR) repeat protein